REREMCQSRYNRWFGSSGKRLKRKQTRSQSPQAHVSFLLFITCILLPGLHTDSICVCVFRDYSTQLNARSPSCLQQQERLQKALQSLITEFVAAERAISAAGCREMDNKVVESIIEDAKKHYAEKAKVASPNITIDEKVFLPPPPNPKLPDSHDLH
ncbi:hypothetical protein HID58_075157, partial [Brassica napus]